MLQFDDPLVRQVIGCAIEVHRHLGPGLLESVYQKCLAHELTSARIAFVRQMPLPLVYKGLVLEAVYRLDFLVDRRLVVETKTVDRLVPVHTAQVLSYLKLLSVPHGLLINFQVPRLADGIRSVILAQATTGLGLTEATEPH